MRRRLVIVLVGVALLALGFGVGFVVAKRIDSSTPPKALVSKTGQTISIVPKDDKDLNLGVDWPNPRFTDNGNGTVSDNLTGLIWLKDANCFGPHNWSSALALVSSLAAPKCDLSDSSSAGDWALPNIRQLESMVHYGFVNPAVPNTTGKGNWKAGDPFVNIQAEIYWSSTTSAFQQPLAWTVFFYDGYANYDDKKGQGYVWPVRRGD